VDDLDAGMSHRSEVGVLHDPKDKSANTSSLEARVVRAAEAALTAKNFVAPVDILVGMGWLASPRIDEWRQGRVDYLERVTTANLNKISNVMHLFRRWARARGLHPSETAYPSRTRSRRTLVFSKSGDPGIERAYRTHWVSPKLSDKQRDRVTQRESIPPDLVAISPLKPWSCSVCGETGPFLLMEDGNPVCLECADMGHLVFLPSGDAALSRRAREASGLSATVVRFSRSRRRYERRGVLVEEAALELAEAACLADEEARARQRLREEERRATDDIEFQERLATEILGHYPACPPGRAAAIARHTGTRGSGRVGRTAAARHLDAAAITLAVTASVRHLDTSYDALLMTGLSRPEASEQVRDQVELTLERWRGRK